MHSMCTVKAWRLGREQLGACQGLPGPPLAVAPLFRDKESRFWGEDAALGAFREHGQKGTES